MLKTSRDAQDEAQRKAWATLTPKVRGAIEAAVPGQLDRLSLAYVLTTMPARYHTRLVKRYTDTAAARGRVAANLDLINIGERFRNAVSPAADDGEIRDAAKRAANEAWRALAAAGSEADARSALLEVAGRYRIAPPPFDEFGKLVNRMTSTHWWRRKLRRQFQQAEAAFIHMGFVHKRAALYLSDEAYSRFESQQRNTDRLLSNLEAVNIDTGETFPLADLAEHSLSNPRNRRAEIMVRVKGTEHHADSLGYVGLFLTITCPSRMHPRHHSGEQNPKFDGTTPKSAQGHLQRKVWQPARAAFDRLGIPYFGLRVVEPHHDGTPHWHMLVFVKPDRKDELLATLRSYALRSDPDEPGADEHRFKVEIIDKAKGGAVAYVAKYIAKNLDGENVGTDLENGGDATRTAPRAVAWARLWGVRQFQPFGTPAVTIWRELRRLRELTPAQEALFGTVWEAANDGNFADFLNLQTDKAKRLVPLWQEEESTRYRGEKARRVVGLRIPIAGGEPVEFVTRGERWEIQLRDQRGEAESGQFSAPWTRVNNCTDKHLRGFQASERSPDELFLGCPENQPGTRQHPYKKERPPTEETPIKRPINTDLTGQSIAP